MSSTVKASELHRAANTFQEPLNKLQPGDIGKPNAIFTSVQQIRLEKHTKLYKIANFEKSNNVYTRLPAIIHSARCAVGALLH